MYFKKVSVANYTFYGHKFNNINYVNINYVTYLFVNRGESSNWMGVESLVMHAFGDNDVCVFTFCKDLKIRVWSLKVSKCDLFFNWTGFIFHSTLTKGMIFRLERPLFF